MCKCVYVDCIEDSKQPSEVPEVLSGEQISIIIIFDDMRMRKFP